MPDRAISAFHETICQFSWGLDAVCLFKYSQQIKREYLNMAKAHLSLPDGTKVLIEGTPEEVAALVARFSKVTTPETSAPSIPSKKSSTARPGLNDLISELIDGGFFKQPRELGAIKTALQEQGHHYPVTSLSPSVLRLVRRKQLRRLKEKNRWMYVR